MSYGVLRHHITSCILSQTKHAKRSQQVNSPTPMFFAKFIEVSEYCKLRPFWGPGFTELRCCPGTSKKTLQQSLGATLSGPAGRCFQEAANRAR